MKLAIANVSDNSYDSGVFLKSNSYKSPWPFVYLNCVPRKPGGSINTITKNDNNNYIDVFLKIEPVEINRRLFLTLYTNPSDTVVLGEDYNVEYSIRADSLVLMTGDSVEFSLLSKDSTLVMRVSIPDSANFVGVKTIDLVLKNELCLAKDIVNYDTLRFFISCDSLTIISHEVIEDASLKFFPNPTNDIVYFQAEGDIKVYNLQGALLKETYGKQVDLSLLPPGTYILQLNGKKGKVVKK